jgi:hypothetical protein
MQTIARQLFLTVRTEGGLLPSDLLANIMAGRLDGQAPIDYGLAKNERINEAISRAWAACQAAWARFGQERAALPADDAGTTLTRERWLLPLLAQLGYAQGEAPLRFVGTLTADGERRYPISHLAGRLPLHLVTFRQDLDRRSTVDTAVRRSPHAIMQEFLNRADGYSWGIISNGLRLRVMRDNAALTRQAYVEFDLEGIFQGEQYSDFALLWLLCHRTRAAGDDPATFWLEHWRQHAGASGARALDALRDGVERAIVALGSGFIARQGGGAKGRPLNEALVARLRSGALARQDFYWQLLRLVYRLIFVFVAEDRDLLHPPEADLAARERYATHYSTERLRRIARQTRGDAHVDAYRALRLLFDLLRGDAAQAQGRAGLGLPALGGYLFGNEATPDLDADLPNSALYQAVRELALTQTEGALRPVDYANLGAIELGSVYEALLEMRPTIDVEAPAFDLSAVAGSERKTTGSYYTPTELVESLLDTALEPVVAERLASSPLATRQEAALLSIRVVDPACGSGHFLLGAANRLAARLASIRSGEDEPSLADQRTALRDVVVRCIYGVDLNPMAVELCKINLWLETLSPGRPLSYLDANIKAGNSLLGATPALLARGVPDEAFTPIAGDDRQVASEWKKENRQARKEAANGVMRLFDPDTYAPWQRLGELGTALANIMMAPDDTLGDVQAKEELYRDYVASLPYEYSRLWADAWCAAFVMRKSARWDYGLTERRFRELQASPHRVAGWLKDEVRGLAERYRFFHWQLEFPHILRRLPADQAVAAAGVAAAGIADDVCGWAGGFDVVLGNPPWERIKLQEKEFFAGRDEAVVSAPNAAARRRAIARLQQTNPPLYDAYLDALCEAEGWSHMLRNSGRYPLCGRGDINTYAVFAELARHLTAPAGRAGIIVPSGIATDDTTKFFFGDLVARSSLASLYDFENRQKIFAAIDSRIKFCLLTMAGAAQPAETAEFAFFLQSAGDLADHDRRFSLSPAEIALINPNTRTCPVFRGRRDAELTKEIYRRVPVLIRDATERAAEANPWSIRFGTMFHMSNDSALFRTRGELEAQGYRLTGNAFVRTAQSQGDERYLPLYEGKMVHQFDHRWAGWGVAGDVASAGAGEDATRDLALAEKQDPTVLPLPRYWVSEDEVSVRISTAPSFVVDGFKGGDRRTMRSALWMWIFGYLKRRSRGRAALCALQHASDLPTPPKGEHPPWYQAMRAEDAAIAPGQIDREHPLGPAEWRLLKVHGFRDVRATLALLLAHASPRWLLGFRDITNTTNERTAIFALMPRAAVGNKAPLWFLAGVEPELRVCVCACMDSFMLDYLVRQKVGGTSMTYHYVKQFPVLPPSAYGAAERAFIVPRALELTYTAWDLAALGAEVAGRDAPPFGWDEARRFQLRAELDALFFHLYGLARDDVAYIMDTFSIVKRKDEAAHEGAYRTKEAILEVYDALAQLGGAWDRYVSPLDPPPGDGRARHGEETRPSWARGGRGAGRPLLPMDRTVLDST